MQEKYCSFILYVCDTETTGFDSDSNEIIELSMLRINDNSQKTWLIQPKNLESIQADALRVNGHKLEDLKHLTKFGKDSYLPAEDVIAEIENWMMEDCSAATDRVLVGQNCAFDMQFLKSFWKKLGQLNTFPFGQRPFCLDTMQIALLMDLASEKRRDYYNLSSLVTSFGVKKEKAHRADSDTRMTSELFLKQLEIVTKLMKNEK